MANELMCWDGAGRLVFDGNTKNFRFINDFSMGFNGLVFDVYNGYVNSRSIVTGYAYLNNKGRNYPVSCNVFEGGFKCLLPRFGSAPGWSTNFSGTLYYKVFNY